MSGGYDPSALENPIGWTFMRSVVPGAIDPDWLTPTVGGDPPENAVIEPPPWIQGNPHLAGGELSILTLPYDAIGRMQAALLRTGTTVITFEGLARFTDNSDPSINPPPRHVYAINSATSQFLGFITRLRSNISTTTARGFEAIPRITGWTGLDLSIDSVRLFYRLG